MKRIGFLLKVNPEKIPEYKKLHGAVWPEMIEALRRNGWHKYSLFLRQDGQLFGVFETPDSFQAALEGMSKEEVNKKWQDMVASCFESLNGLQADEAMEELEEIFHID
jgi:L-rhamnose mutarotase